MRKGRAKINSTKDILLVTFLDFPPSVRLAVACGKCGLIKHPQFCVRQCPVGVCHDCRRPGRRGGGGCSLEEGRAYLEAFLEEFAARRLEDAEVEEVWAHLKRQLGI